MAREKVSDLQAARRQGAGASVGVCRRQSGAGGGARGGAPAGVLRGDKNGFYLSTELNSLDGNIKAIFRDILVDQTITKTLSEGIQCLLNK